MSAKNENEKGDLPSVRAELAPRMLRAWVEMIAPITSGGRRRRHLGEALVRASRDGLRVVALTPDNIAGVDALLAREACESYSCPLDGEFGIDLDKLHQISKLARPDQLIRLEIVPDIDGAHLEATIGRLVRTCSLVSGIPRLELPVAPVTTARATLSAESWAAALRSAGATSDDITLRTDGAAVTVEAAGEVEATSDPVDADFLEGSARALYPLAVLGQVARAISRAAEVRAAWSTDGVLRLEAAMGGRHYVGLSAVYLQAPRVEEAPEESAPTPEPVTGDAYPAELAELAEQDVEEVTVGPVAHVSPEIAEAFGMQALVEAGLAVIVPPTPEPEVEEPTIPAPVGPTAPEAARGGAPGCVVCLGWGRIYSRTRDYGCPGCGGTQWADRPAGPTVADRRDGCVEAVIRGFRLSTGRDAS